MSFFNDLTSGAVNIITALNPAPVLQTASPIQAAQGTYSAPVTQQTAQSNFWQSMNPVYLVYGAVGLAGLGLLALVR